MEGVKFIDDIDPKIIGEQNINYNSQNAEIRLLWTRTIYRHNGFFSYVDQYYNEKDKTKFVPTKQAAYERVEALHIIIFGERKYSSYDSYRVCRRKLGY